MPMNDMELSLKQKKQNWTTITTRCNTPKNTMSDVLVNYESDIRIMRPNARGLNRYRGYSSLQKVKD